MRKIRLSTGEVVKVSSQDYDSLKKHKWCKRGRGYAATRLNGKQVYMHRLIMGDTAFGFALHHKNHNILDNRRENLEALSWTEHAWLSRPRGKSKFKGVYETHEQRSPWRGKICYFGQGYYLGHFQTEIEAALAYDKKALELGRPIESLNFQHVIKRASVIRQLEKTNRIFSVFFRKRTNGKMRLMVAIAKRPDRDYKPLLKKRKLLLVWDMTKKNYRAIPKEGVIAVCMNKKKILVA